MTGLDKIIGKILEEANETARATLERAREDCRLMEEEYAKKADLIRADIATRAKEQGESMIARARSSTVMTRRTMIEAARRSAMDEAFDAALVQIRSNQYGQYQELLSALLACALTEVAKAEDESLALGDEIEEYDTFEVLLSADDRALYGNAVVEGARHVAERRIGTERMAKVRLAEECAPIDGGVVLRYGHVEMNCSLPVVLSQLRQELEKKLSAVLYETQDAHDAV